MALTLVSRGLLRLLTAQGFTGPMPDDLSLLRAATDRAVLPLWLPRLGVASVRELVVPGAAGPMPARLYWPRGLRRGAPLGVTLFIHGGGFVHCGLNSHDGICCRLASASRTAVLSIDYRLAPEHPFPAAVEDAYAALVWLAANQAALGLPNLPIAVAGDSAGGNLAAVIAQLARDRAGPAIRFQLLFYPTTHGGRPVPSHELYADGYLLTTALMHWYMARYIDENAHRADTRFAPIAAASLAGLPPACIVTAEYDPLRDEGAEYAAALTEAGVPTDYHCVTRVFHAFLNFYPMLARGRRGLAVGGRAIRRAFGGQARVAERHPATLLVRSER